LVRPQYVGILHPGMEFIPEVGHGKTRENVKKSHRNDPALQRFELRGKVEKAWNNNAGEKEEQRRRNLNL